MNEDEMNINDSEDEELKHYGVLGMKWGKRKVDNESSPTVRKGNGKGNEPRRMSNKELTARIKRLRMEQEFDKLSEATNPATVSKIERATKTIGTVAALTSAAITLYNNCDKIAKIAKTAKTVTTT